MNSIRVIGPSNKEIQRIAKRIRKKVFCYRIPGNVKKITGIGRIKDITEPWLIVLCTPETKDNETVRKEIGNFISQGKRKNILAVLLAGGSEESFPEELLYEILPSGDTRRTEPLAANLTTMSGRFHGSDFNTELLRILAAILDVSFDELNRRHFRRKRRIIYGFASVILMLSVVFFGYALERKEIITGQGEALDRQYSLQEESTGQMEEKRDEIFRLNQLFFAEKAEEAYEAYDSELALIYCLSAIDSTNPKISEPKLQEVFDKTLDRMCAAGYVPITERKVYYERNGNNRRYETQETPTESGVFITDNGVEYTIETGERCGVFNVAKGSFEKEIVLKDTIADLRISADGKLGIITDKGILVGDIEGDSEFIILPYTAVSLNYARFVELFNGKKGIRDELYGSEIIDTGKIIYEYHENATEIPDDIEGKLELAGRLTYGRQPD